MNLNAFSVLCFSYGTLLVGILAIAKQKDRISSLFLIFCLVVCGWSFLFSLWITQNYDQQTTLRIIRLSYVFVMFIPITWIHFLLGFLDQKEPFKYFYALNYCAAALLALSCPTDWMFSGTHALGSFKYLPTPGPLHHIHMAFYALLVPLGYYHLIRGIWQSAGSRRFQLWALLLGTIAGFSAGTANYLTFYKIPAPLELHLLMPLYPFLTGLAMIRYGLFDAGQIADSFHQDKLAAIGIISASINHEIRNPIFIIKELGNSHLANVREALYKNHTEHTERADGVIQKTVIQAERAMAIIQKLTSFSKQSSGQAQPEAISLSTALANILPLVTHELKIENVELTASLPEELPDIYADPRHMEEILFNLIINACQALKKQGSGKIEITAHAKENKVQVSITDNGPGIAPEKRSRVFTPFYTTKEGGTGLGLYIVKRLVEHNQGSIKVSSTPGNTCFSIEFPGARK